MRVMRLERGGEGEGGGGDAIMGGANVWAQIWEVHVYIISYMNVVINRKQKIVHTHALLSFVSVAFVFFPPTKSESS